MNAKFKHRDNMEFADDKMRELERTRDALIEAVLAYEAAGGEIEKISIQQDYWHKDSQDPTTLSEKPEDQSIFSVLFR